jgi:anti-sigma factor ChrR (cupin superfamily)
MEQIGARTAPTKDQTHIVDVLSMEWREIDPGVLAKVLYRDDATGAATVLFKFAPGTQAPMHEHTGLEQTYVIEGELEDHDGVVTAGNFAVRKAGSVHAASSKTGSLHLAFFSKPVRKIEGGLAAFSETGARAEGEV